MFTIRAIGRTFIANIADRRLGNASRIIIVSCVKSEAVWSIWLEISTGGNKTTSRDSKFAIVFEAGIEKERNLMGK